MKKGLLTTILMLTIALFYTQNTYAQFGLKKLKNNTTKSVKNKLIDEAFNKITDLCVGDKNNKALTKISPSDKAYNEYQSLQKDIDKLKINIDNMDVLELGKNVKKVLKRLKAIKKSNPNIDLRTECKRISDLKTKIKK